MVVTIARIGETVTCDYCLEEFEVSRPQTGPLSKRVPDRMSDVTPVPDSLELAEDFDLQLTLEDEATPAAEDRVTVKDREYADSEELATDYEFTVACPLCSTRLSATHLQVGKKIKCPDCFSSFEIRTPPKHARRKRTSALTDDTDDEFKLSDPVERPQYEPQVNSTNGLGTEPPETRPPEDGDAWASPPSPGRDALRKAELEFDEAEQATRALPDRPLTSGTLSFLADVNTLARMMVLAVALQLVAAAGQGAFHGLASSGLAKVGALLLFVFFLVFGLVCFVASSVSMLTITQEIAGGNDRVETWPAVDIEWFYESLYLGVALVAGFLPGFGDRTAVPRIWARLLTAGDLP